ncbi:MAG TPA: 3-methyl-2-oxobutanoate hydroxymethyltransferase [Vicinamibacterales bacterium]|nr:3-methyl-2-oxobutanoate hydroxymethyltransferase [Vicinamibacterales bacterium]
MDDRMTVAALRQMKRNGRKIVGVVVYDYQMAQIADRAGVEIVSAGDSVGVTLWGHASEADVTIDQMLLVCQAVRRGVIRALVSCDLPVASLQDTPETAVGAAMRLLREGAADLVKVDVAAASADVVRAMTRSSIPVWAQFGVATAPLDAPAVDRLVREAQQLEEVGASLLDFRHSGPIAGPAVVRAVHIPVLGGVGGGPWLDGRIRSLAAAIGYLASAVDDTTDRYANVGAVALSAISALCDDVRAGRPLRGAAPASRS